MLMQRVQKYTIRLLLALVLAVGEAHGQYDGNYDSHSIAAFEQDTSQHIISFEGFLLDVADGMADALGIALFVVVLFLTATGHGGELNYRAMFKEFLLPFVLVKYILAHWLTVISGLGYSFSGLFSASAAFLSQHIQTQTVQTMYATVYTVQDRLGPEPSIFNSHWWTFQVIQAAMAVFQLPSFFVLFYSVLARAMGLSIGPLFLLAKLIPVYSDIWSSWVRTMIKYTLYPVFVAIYVAVVAAYFTTYLTNAFPRGFTLDSIAPKLADIIVMTLVFVFTAFKIPHMVADFTAGTATSGQGVLSAITGSITRFIGK